MRSKRMARPALAVLSLVGLAGCTTTVTPPAEVAEPVRVALLDHGRHASLVLERPGGGVVRYAYGDWRWYARNDTGPAQGLAALLWPTRGALGRKHLDGPIAPAALARQVGPPIEVAFAFTVEADAAARLLGDLDVLFSENGSTATYNRRFDLTFVHHPEPYWMLNNSNQMTARWLERLGCRIDGPALFSDWARTSAR